MAKISFQQIPDGFDLLYSKALNSGDKYVVPSVRRNVLFSRQRRKKGMTQKSLLPILTPVYNSLSDAEKEAWASASAINNTRPLNLFIRDTSYRINEGLSGYATPSDIYQVLAGEIQVTSPASNIKIAQLHPFNYYVIKKIVGTKSQYEPVEISESFALPLHLEISYKSDLVSVGDASFAKFYAVVESHYQGRKIETRCEIVFDFFSDWTRLTADLTSVVGLPTGYTLYIEIFNATGTLWFDNVVAEHNSFNWARDAFCNHIRTAYTRAYYQVPRNWISVDLPDGAFYDSIYYH